MSLTIKLTVTLTQTLTLIGESGRGKGGIVRGNCPDTDKNTHARTMWYRNRCYVVFYKEVVPKKIEKFMVIASTSVNG